MILQGGQLTRRAVPRLRGGAPPWREEADFDTFYMAFRWLLLLMILVNGSSTWHIIGNLGNILLSTGANCEEGFTGLLLLLLLLLLVVVAANPLATSTSPTPRFSRCYSSSSISIVNCTIKWSLSLLFGCALSAELHGCNMILIEVWFSGEERSSASCTFQEGLAWYEIGQFACTYSCQHVIQFFLPMIIVRCEMRCKMCREGVPGYKYFIFTDEDVTLKV